MQIERAIAPDLPCRLCSAASVGLVPSAQSLPDCVIELIGRERLDEGSGELDAELEQLRRWRGDTRADHRQPRIDDASSLCEHRAGRRRGLDYQHVSALQLFGSRHSREDRLVAEARDHPLEQPPDIFVGLAYQYSCHVSMIDRARWIPGGQTV